MWASDLSPPGLSRGWNCWGAGKSPLTCPRSRGPSSLPQLLPHVPAGPTPTPPGTWFWPWLALSWGCDVASSCGFGCVAIVTRGTEPRSWAGWLHARGVSFSCTRCRFCVWTQRKDPCQGARTCGCGWDTALPPPPLRLTREGRAGAGPECPRPPPTGASGRAQAAGPQPRALSSHVSGVSAPRVGVAGPPGSAASEAVCREDALGRGATATGLSCVVAVGPRPRGFPSRRAGLQGWRVGASVCPCVRV